MGSDTTRLKEEVTVLPLLDFLENTIIIEYTFRQVATKHDCKYYIEHLQQQSYNGSPDKPGGLSI